MRGVGNHHGWHRDFALELWVSETGKYDPSLALAFKIARLFHLTIEEIFQPDLTTINQT